MRPAVFLDRDGTLIAEVGYLGDPDGVALLPGVPDALRRLREAGYALVLVSNQAGVARGYFTEEDVLAVNGRLEEMLADEGLRLDGWEYCTHHPEVTGPCDCRKPAPGMLHRAARELDLDLARSWIVGDHPSDVEAGHRAGGRGILVLSGHTHEHDDELPKGVPGVPVVPDLAAATDVILDTATVTLS